MVDTADIDNEFGSYELVLTVLVSVHVNKQVKKEKDNVLDSLRDNDMAEKTRMQALPSWARC